MEFLNSIIGFKLNNEPILTIVGPYCTNSLLFQYYLGDLALLNTQ